MCEAGVINNGLAGEFGNIFVGPGGLWVEGGFLFDQRSQPASDIPFWSNYNDLTSPQKLAAETKGNPFFSGTSR